MQLDLAFAGGGAKGIVHLGALEEIISEGHSFRRLVGTSAGTIISTLLAAHYTPHEIVSALTEKLPSGETRYGTFMDIPSGFDKEIIENSRVSSSLRAAEPSFITDETAASLNEKVMASLLKKETFRQFFSFVHFGGVYSGDNFLHWIKDMLDAKMPGLGSTTFAEFHEKTGSDLTAVATDTVSQLRLILNHRTAPDLPVIWVPRMSMSIPFVWQEVLWKSEWGLYNGKDISNHSIVDGGVVSNFPLDLLLSKDAEIVKAMGRKPNPRRTIGLLIDITLPVEGAPTTPPEKKILGRKISLSDDWDSVEKRVENLMNTMMRANDNIVKERHAENICRLPAMGYDTLEFDMGEERTELLFNAGRNAMRAHLKKMKTYFFDELDIFLAT